MLNPDNDNVSLNGIISTRADAHINVDDRGFRFGDGVFETIAVLDGTPHLWLLHHERLRIGLHALDIPAMINDLYAQITHLIARNHVTTGIVRIIITRGIGSQGYAPTHAGAPTIFLEACAQAIPLATCLSAPADTRRLHISPWLRPSPRSLPTHAKLMQGLNPTLARMDATKAGYDDALLLSTDGHVCEATSSNIIWRSNNMLYTPHKDTGCIEGTMLHHLKDLIPIASVSMAYSNWQATTPDAAILTNALQGCVPIASINDMEFPNSAALAHICNRHIMQP